MWKLLLVLKYSAVLTMYQSCCLLPVLVTLSLPGGDGSLTSPVCWCFLISFEMIGQLPSLLRCFCSFLQRPRDHLPCHKLFYTLPSPDSCPNYAMCVKKTTIVTINVIRIGKAGTRAGQGSLNVAKCLTLLLF